MTSGVRTFLQLLVVVLVVWPAQGLAYSYASPDSDPLLKGQDAYMDGVNKGDWSAVQTAYDGFKEEIETLQKGEDAFAGDPGLESAFTDAIKNKDAAGAKAALERAFVDQINRRLTAAGKELKTSGDNDEAKSLVATASALFDGISGNLPADQQKSLSTAFENATDAIGKEGLFGWGEVAPDPAKLKTAVSTILTTLQGDVSGSGASQGGGSDQKTDDSKSDSGS